MSHSSSCSWSSLHSSTQKRSEGSLCAPLSERAPSLIHLLPFSPPPPVTFGLFVPVDEGEECRAAAFLFSFCSAEGEQEKRDGGRDREREREGGMEGGRTGTCNDPMYAHTLTLRLLLKCRV